MARTTKEYQAFTRLVDRLLAIPRSTIKKRMAEHREKAVRDPHKRGQNSKVRPPSATDPDEESGNS
jgi:hypothetical protein